MAITKSTLITNPTQYQDLVLKGITEGFKIELKAALMKHAEEIVEEIAKDVANRMAANVAMYNDLSSDAVKMQVNFNYKT